MSRVSFPLIAVRSVSQGVHISHSGAFRGRWQLKQLRLVETHTSTSELYKRASKTGKLSSPCACESYHRWLRANNLFISVCVFFVTSECLCGITNISRDANNH